MSQKCSTHSARIIRVYTLGIEVKENKSDTTDLMLILCSALNKITLKIYSEHITFGKAFDLGEPSI